MYCVSVCIILFVLCFCVYYVSVCVVLCVLCFCEYYIVCFVFLCVLCFCVCILFLCVLYCIVCICPVSVLVGYMDDYIYEKLLDFNQRHLWNKMRHNKYI